jgi:hypothetical protein
MASTFFEGQGTLHGFRSAGVHQLRKWTEPTLGFTLEHGGCFIAIPQGSASRNPGLHDARPLALTSDQSISEAAVIGLRTVTVGRICLAFARMIAASSTGIFGPRTSLSMKSMFLKGIHSSSSTFRLSTVSFITAISRISFSLVNFLLLQNRGILPIIVGMGSSSFR